MPEGQVQFQTDNQNEFGRPPRDTSADITGKMVAWGLVSTRTEAQYVMIGVAALAFVAAFFFFFTSVGGSSAPPPPPPGLAPQASYQ